MGYAILEQVTLGDADRQDGVAEGVIKAVHRSESLTTSASPADVALDAEGNTLIVTAVTGDVLVCVTASDGSFSATKAKIVLAGSDAALHYNTGDVARIREFAQAVG